VGGSVWMRMRMLMLTGEGGTDLLIFVVCGGIVFELVRIVFGAGQGYVSG